MSVKKINNQNFDNEILNCGNVALVDFYADWCGPCKMMSPVIDEIAEEMADITVGKVNIDESSDIALRYNVMSIPTIIVFKDGNEIARSVGFKPKKNILEMLK